jgi:hypothetical protein
MIRVGVLYRALAALEAAKNSGKKLGTMDADTYTQVVRAWADLKTHMDDQNINVPFERERALETA